MILRAPLLQRGAPLVPLLCVVLQRVGRHPQGGAVVNPQHEDTRSLYAERAVLNCRSEPKKLSRTLSKR